VIDFDIKKLRVEHVMIKSVSGALGGTVTILDKARSTDKHEVFTKVRVPVAVARGFAKTYEMRAYMKPVLGAIVYYDGHVVALERHPLGNLAQEVTEGVNGLVTWQSQSEINIEGFLSVVTSLGTWFVDGTYVYTFADDAIDNATNMNDDGTFRQVKATAVKLADLAFKDIAASERVSLAYYTKTGDYTITAPIWKTLEKIGSKELEKATDDESVTYLSVDMGQFDKIDEHLCVNLSFALKAGRELSDVFGYDSIQPLNLPELMLQLRTVNLPNVASTVKTTYDTGLPFTHAVAWLIGLSRRVETLNSYMVVRSLLRYLTTRGVYRKGAFNSDSIFCVGRTADNVPLMSLAVATDKE
jgi:hypothetical protein